MKIRICDDDVDMAAEWVSEIKDSVPDDFDVAQIGDAKKEISALVRRKIAVEGEKDPAEETSEFDEIDILVVDYDLVHLDDDGGRTTGEGIARLARTYSSCGAIVVMNQFKGPQFDLGMRGHLDSFADLNVDAGLIGMDALWQSKTPDGSFNPTIWTPMPTVREAGRALADKIDGSGMDEAIVAFMGLEDAAISKLSDTAFGFLSTSAETSEELSKVTVLKFLKSYLGETLCDNMMKNAQSYLLSFAAFRLRKWLDRAVLRPMDVLIDLPHLIDRLPFLIDGKKGDVSDPAAWTAALVNPAGLLLWPEIEKFHNPAASEVLGKSVFDWFRMVDDARIEELQEAYLDEQPARFHLAEDTSRYLPRDKLTRYRADFHNFGDRRSFENVEGLVYGPQRRMRFG